MANVRVETSKSRRIYPWREIVGYRWINGLSGDFEVEMLSCGHTRRTGHTSQELETGDFFDEVEATLRRRCKECVPQWAKNPTALPKFKVKFT